MSKTQLTRDIEAALTTYQPSAFEDFEINYRREQYKDFEVPVTKSHIEGGLVDCVWLAEGYNNHSCYSYCNAARRIHTVEHLTREVKCSLTESEIRSIGANTFYPCLYDGKCFWKRQRKSKDEAVAVICFEIKVSQVDFKSPNGHNFCGNLNYYVMPTELFKQLTAQQLIPAEIGVITFNVDSKRLRIAKHCRYNPEVDMKLYNQMLHTFLNKQSKKYSKLKRCSYDCAHSIIDKYDSAIYKVIKKLRSSYKENAPACYEEGFDKCCTVCEPSCGQCLFSPYLSEKIHSKVQAENMLIEAYSKY